MHFGRFSTRTRYGTEGRILSEINVTPMVDVMLVLLVIFIIASPLLLRGLSIELPQVGGQAVHEAAPGISITLDAQGRVYWDHTALDATQLEARLAAVSDRTTEVHVRADQATRYATLAQLLAMLEQHGMNHVVFLTEVPRATH